MQNAFQGWLDDLGQLNGVARLLAALINLAAALVRRRRSLR